MYFKPPPLQKTSDFEFKLSQIIALGQPIAKAVHCLESNTANACDVYMLVHAVMFELEEILLNPSNEFKDEICKEVIGIMNARYNQLFDPSAPRSLATKAYLAAYLNPST